MKIAQVSHSYLPVIGGIQNYVYRLSRDILTEGSQVEVLTTDIDINKKDFEKMDRKFGFEVKYFHSYLTILGNPFPLGLIPHLMKNEYDLIHVHSIQAIPSLISAMLKKRAKFIVTPHGISPDDKRFLVKFVWNIYKPLSKFICKRADKVIVLGSKEKEKIIRLFDMDESKIDVIPNGIEVEEEPSITIIYNFKYRFGLENFHIILFVGRVSPTKNPEILIKAFKKVHIGINDTKLTFVGPISDSYRSKLIDLARELNIDKFIVFTGEVNREDVLSAYYCADIFVSLGGWEGLPTTMLEAMSFGLPCIMFNSGGIGDVIKDGETGLIVNDLNSEKIAEKIMSLLEGHDLMEEISRNARKESLENYRWEYCFKKIYSIYETFIMEEFYEQI